MPYPSDSEIRSAQSKAVGGGRKRCTKGKSCSAACIDPNEFCLVEIPASLSSEIDKVRNSIKEGGGVEQLKLFPVSDYVTKEKLKEHIESFRKDNRDKIRDAIGNSSKEDYNKHRQEVIDFNKKLVENGLAEKGGLVKVPVSWEKLQKVTEAYNKAEDTLLAKMEDSALLGDKKGYDRAERRLLRMYEKLSDRLGYNDYDNFRKGKIWDRNDGDSRQENNFLSGLRQSPELRSTKISFKSDYELSITKKVGEHTVSVNLRNNGTEFSFQINDRYTKPSGLSVKDGLKIAAVTEKLFSEVVSHMDEGSVVSVYPYNGDGRGDKRRRAYERFGFASDGDSMYGMVNGGRIIPATYGDYRNFYLDEQFNFVESKVNRTKNMYLALWGEDPPAKG